MTESTYNEPDLPEADLGTQARASAFGSGTNRSDARLVTM
jgi:hypothetical protein